MATQSNNNTAISLKNIDKFYGDFQALKQVNLEVKTGQRVVVCGPSGSGKSTLIRCINRLEVIFRQHEPLIIQGTCFREDGTFLRFNLASLLRKPLEATTKPGLHINQG